MSKKPHLLPTFATIVPSRFVNLEGAIHLFYNFYCKAFYNLSVKGCPYDNSCIEAWYNRERIHSSLNYRTPDEVYSNLEKLIVA